MRKYFFYLRIFFLYSLCAINKDCRSQQSKSDSLFSKLRAVKTDTAKINLLNALAKEYTRKNPDSALLMSKEALEISEKANWLIGKGRSAHLIADINQKTGNNNEALAYFIKELNAWEEIGKADDPDIKPQIKLEIAIALNNIGVMYDIMGNYDESVDYYSKGLKFFRELNNKDRIAQSLVGMGVVYSEQGLYSRSMGNYFQGLKIFEESGNKNGMAKTYGNIGIVYGTQGDQARALTYHLKALKVAEEIKDINAIASDLTNIAMTYSELKDYNNSIEYYTKALDNTRESGDVYLGAIILNNMGEVYDKMKDYTKAMAKYREAMAGFENLGFKYGIATSFSNIGNLFFETNKYPEAEKYMLRALSDFDSLGLLNEAMKTNMNLSEFYAKTNNYKKALQHYKKASIAGDSLFNQAKTREITSKEMQYEFDKKEAVTKAEQDKKDTLIKAELDRQKTLSNAIAGIAGIIILSSFFIFIFYKRKRDAVQKQKETALSLQVAETEMKALRSQMNPHFLFNALSSIHSFLINNQPEDAGTYLLKFKELVRRVLENSMLKEVTLEEDLKTLELYMQLENIRLDYPFTYQFHIDDKIDSEQTVIPPLILQPFVENAIWHGLQPRPDAGGHISISIHQSENNLLCVVEDNGVGRGSNKIKEKITPFKKDSLGIKLTEERLKIINEQRNTKACFNIIDLFTNENKPCGTRVQLTLPLTYD
jgi:tetratricopeptide (TPR) repeat protein